MSEGSAMEEQNMEDWSSEHDGNFEEQGLTYPIVRADGIEVLKTL